MENKTLSYTGAIIDGEGCILISKKVNKRYQLTISVINTSKLLIDFLFQNFGGHIEQGKPKENHQQFWGWYLFSLNDSIDFLEQINPYLLIKRKQAELALEFAKQRENINKLGNYKRYYIEEQIRIYEEIKRLKQEYPLELPDYNFTEEEKLYYLAGLIDGEGCIRLTKAIHKNKYGNKKLIFVPLISIANTDKRISNFLIKEFKGFTMKKERTGKWKSIYQWYTQGVSKKNFFLNLKDKLLIKNDKLNLLLRYIKIRENNYKHTEEELQIFIKLKELNYKDKEKQNIEKLKEYTELKRSPRKFFIDRKKLENLYLNQKLSIRQIAKQYNVHFESVRSRLIKERIPLRNFKEGRKLNPPKLTEEGRDKIRFAVSNSKKIAWQDPVYRIKMEQNLEMARRIKNQKYSNGFNYPISEQINKSNSDLAEALVT